MQGLEEPPFKIGVRLEQLGHVRQFASGGFDGVLLLGEGE
jgi:hypothetical protein